MYKLKLFPNPFAIPNCRMCHRCRGKRLNCNNCLEMQRPAISPQVMTVQENLWFRFNNHSSNIIFIVPNALSMRVSSESPVTSNITNYSMQAQLYVNMYFVASAIYIYTYIHIYKLHCNEITFSSLISR